MKTIKTHTGKIYVDSDRKLEFLTVGDYGKENNIKADFLGLHKEINGVQNTEVDLTKKWVATISTQKGCPMKCKSGGAKTIHPVISTMLPKSNRNLVKFIHDWCEIKNNDYKGEAGLQFSINSTDEKQRQNQFSATVQNTVSMATLRLKICATK